MEHDMDKKLVFFRYCMGIVCSFHCWGNFNMESLNTGTLKEEPLILENPHVCSELMQNCSDRLAGVGSTL